MMILQFNINTLSNKNSAIIILFKLAQLVKFDLALILGKLNCVIGHSYLKLRNGPHMDVNALTIELLHDCFVRVYSH